MNKKKPEIEKIYVCKTIEEDASIIEKVLIQYVDGSKDYFKLPSFYNKLNLKKQSKERKLLDKKLKCYMEILFKQSHSSMNDQENSKVIIVSNNDKELNEYVDEQIQLVINKYLINSENLQLGVGLYGTLMAGLSLSLSNGFGVIFNTIVSSGNLFFAIKNNKKRTDLGLKNPILKKLKLSFSYFILGLNIGLNISNLNVNFDKMQYSITLENTIHKHNKVLSNLDNPFSDSNRQLLVTTSDAVSNLLMEAFELNPLLDDKDLEIALSTKKYIENNPYLDYEKLYETFATFGVVHTNYFNNNVAGDCKKELGIIDIYNYDNANKYSYYAGTLQHEIIHFTGNLDNIVLNEGMTTLLQAEYFNNGILNNYYNHVLFTKIFCELIGADKMLEAYSKEDMSIIKEEMLKINPNENDYQSLIDALQQYGIKYCEAADNSTNANSEEFYSLLKPYLNSDKLLETTKIEILDYLGYLNHRADLPFQFYFYVNHDSEEIQYWDNNDNSNENSVIKK